MALSNSLTGRMHKVGKKTTQKEKTVFQIVKAYLKGKGEKIHSIYVHDLGNDIFSIDIFGPKFNEYGFGAAGTQVMYSNTLRFIFDDIEIDDMRNGFYKIGGI